MLVRIVAAVCAVVAAGCSERVGPDLSGLYLQESHVGSAISLTATLVADTAVRIVAHNSAATPDTIAHGACAFAARMFAPPDFTRPVWQSVPAAPLPCEDPLWIVLVPPRDSVSIVAARLVAAPPLVPEPPAYGQVRAYLIANGRPVELVAGVRNMGVPARSR